MADRAATRLRGWRLKVRNCASCGPLRGPTLVSGEWESWQDSRGTCTRSIWDPQIEASHSAWPSSGTLSLVASAGMGVGPCASQAAMMRHASSSADAQR